MKYWLLYFAPVAYLLAQFCAVQTDGFSIARIHSELPYDAAWESAPLPPAETAQVRAILSQPFHYLGCGGQAFAFTSQDDKYVIKFFKHRFRKPYSYLYTHEVPLLSRLCQKKKEKALAKTRRDFGSYKIAYEELREETGLLYVHLNRDDNLGIALQITDKLGCRHVLALDGVEFLLQRKGVLAYEYFGQLARQKEIGTFQQGTRALLGKIVSRCEKGIFDEDPKVHRNVAFVEGATDLSRRRPLCKG